MYTDVWPCRSGGDCLQVDYHWDILPGDARGKPIENIGSGWFLALAPESFELGGDDDGYGLYWCKTESCRNYWRLTLSDCVLGLSLKTTGWVVVVDSEESVQHVDEAETNMGRGYQAGKIYLPFPPANSCGAPERSGRSRESPQWPIPP
ncbi:hypothetical protein QBC35DRAFT_474360 [Podospora australis]|uniref:Uncharacterized protein n=1 Tax=Podospora australis TaxID=1536484 RepID=A0AAN6WUI3_9PEZI|nr:hypothetical protein QBC35DRAFT_474360 [Podospora australis]